MTFASVLGVDRLEWPCYSVTSKVIYYNTGFNSAGYFVTENNIGISKFFYSYHSDNVYDFSVWPLSSSVSIIVCQIDRFGNSIYGSYSPTAPTSFENGVCHYDNFVLNSGCYAFFVCILGECDGSKDVFVKFDG